jgi:hypothetical protein
MPEKKRRTAVKNHPGVYYREDASGNRRCKISFADSLGKRRWKVVGGNLKAAEAAREVLRGRIRKASGSSRLARRSLRQRQSGSRRRSTYDPKRSSGTRWRCAFTSCRGSGGPA